MLVRELSVVESLFGLELELPALGKFWIQSTLRNDGVVLEAYLNGGSNPRLVGILALMLKRGATIEYVFVDEQFRGQGVGTQLVQAAASLAKEQEMPVIKARAIIQDPFGGIFSRLLEKGGSRPMTRPACSASAIIPKPGKPGPSSWSGGAAASAPSFKKGASAPFPSRKQTPHSWSVLPAR